MLNASFLICSSVLNPPSVCAEKKSNSVVYISTASCLKKYTNCSACIDAADVVSLYIKANKATSIVALLIPALPNTASLALSTAAFCTVRMLSDALLATSSKRAVAYDLPA